MASRMIYREVQKPRQWWIAAVVLTNGALMWYVFVQQIVLGEPVGPNPAPGGVAVGFWLVFGLIFPLGWASARLVVEVNDENLVVRYVPFFTRRIAYHEIASAQPHQFQPLREYGGWGIRFRSLSRLDRAYTVRGHRGVVLQLHSGERLVLGSDAPHKLAAALNARLTGQLAGQLEQPIAPRQEVR